MRAAITTKECTDVDMVAFDIDEYMYSNNINRLITKSRTLSGEIITSDWGIDNDRYISLVVKLTQEKFDHLKIMQRNQTDSFLFHYLSESFNVMIISLLATPIADQFMVTIELSIISTLTSMD